MEALKVWTWDGAYLLVALSRDYETCAEDEIKNIEALRTVVGNRIVYDKLPQERSRVNRISCSRLRKGVYLF